MITSGGNRNPANADRWTWGRAARGRRIRPAPSARLDRPPPGAGRTQQTRASSQTPRPEPGPARAVAPVNKKPPCALGTTMPHQRCRHADLRFADYLQPYESPVQIPTGSTTQFRNRVYKAAYVSTDNAVLYPRAHRRAARSQALNPIWLSNHRDG